MHFVVMLLCFLCALCAAFASGYGVALTLLPERYQEYRFIVSPTIGYTVLCGLTYVMSASFHASVGASAQITFGILVLYSVAAWWKVSKGKRWAPLISGVGETVLLSSAMLIVILWPLFYVGTTYLGAVNPDYFAAFKDNQFLRHASVLQVGAPATVSYSPFFSGIGNISPAARFGSAFFAMMLEVVFGFTTRTALTTSIGVFMYCLPLSVYFMARTVFSAAVRVARLAALLTGISGCLCMSFLYFYVGQNSGLAVVPLLLALLYITFTDPSVRISILAALIANSLFFMYLGMLPYACAPVAVLAAYLIWKRQVSARMLALIVASFVICIVILDLRLARDFLPVLLGWKNVIGQTLQGQYFVSFLTEEFFPMFLGLVIYPLTQSAVIQIIGPRGVMFLLALSAVILIWLGVVAVDWARREKDKRPVIFAFGAAVIYLAVWWFYSFPREYGYAVFKMSAWLQFMLVIAYAGGLYRSFAFVRGIKSGIGQRLARIGCYGLAVVLVGGNLLTSLQYGYQGLGTDPERGYIVNNFQMSGNYDYFSLAPSLKKIVGPKQSVALAASDVIQNSWISYYLRNFRLSLLSHYLFPGDDENLPDVITRRTVDYYGNQSVDNNAWFHGLSDDYILAVNSEHVNADIVDQDLPKPVWSNRTFELIKASEVPDFAFTGRGFYRVESLHSDLPYWWPGKWRWTSKGGEIYFLHRSNDVRPYQLSFTAMVGYGAPTAKRHLEVWLNRKIVDEVVVNGNARVTTHPFTPAPGVNLLVVRAKESVRALPRPAPLWNRDIPEDYRGLNFAVSRVRVLQPDYSWPSAPAVMRGKQVIGDAQEFDGMELSGWVREEGRLAYMRPPGSSAVQLEIWVPSQVAVGNSCAITFDADGTRRSALAKAGPLRVSIPLQPTTAPTLTEIRIQPCRSIIAPDSDPRIRPVLQSVQVRGVSFVTGSVKDDMRPPYTGLEAVGLDADGWFLNQASFKVPDPSAHEIQLEVEFPGWAKVQRCNLAVSVNGRQVWQQPVSPGIRRLRVPIQGTSTPADVKLTSDVEFRLPTPDTRVRSLRLVSLHLF